MTEEPGCVFVTVATGGGSGGLYSVTVAIGGEGLRQYQPALEAGFCYNSKWGWKRGFVTVAIGVGSGLYVCYSSNRGWKQG